MIENWHEAPFYYCYNEYTKIVEDFQSAIIALRLGAYAKDLANNDVNSGFIFGFMPPDGIPCVSRPAPVSTNVPLDKYITFELFPNPATSQVQLQFGEAVPQARVRLYTLEGRQVGGEQVVSNAVNSIDVGHLPKGMYWVQVYTDVCLYATQKLVVQ